MKKIMTGRNCQVSHPKISCGVYYIVYSILSPDVSELFRQGLLCIQSEIEITL